MYRRFFNAQVSRNPRLHAQEVSQRSIASSCGYSRNSVSDVLKRAGELEITWSFENDISDIELQTMFFPKKNKLNARKQPDYESVHEELAKSGVTLSLLWHEYVEECRSRKEIPYSYRHFCRFYHRFVTTTKATMPIKRKPGEVMEVDWAGQTASLSDNLTGEPIPTYVFVATLSCSQYTYVEAFLSMDMESWITAHLRAYQFFWWSDTTCAGQLENRCRQSITNRSHNQSHKNNPKNSSFYYKLGLSGSRNPQLSISVSIVVPYRKTRKFPH